MTPQLKFLNGIRDAVRPDPKVWVDEWAEQNRVLPPDTPEPGQWRNHRTPYLIDIMRTMSPGSLYREGWVMFQSTPIIADGRALPWPMRPRWSP